MRRTILILLGATLLVTATPVSPPTLAGTRPDYVARVEPLPDGIRAWMNGLLAPGLPRPAP